MKLMSYLSSFGLAAITSLWRCCFFPDGNTSLCCIIGKKLSLRWRNSYYGKWGRRQLCVHYIILLSQEVVTVYGIEHQGTCCPCADCINRAPFLPPLPDHYLGIRLFIYTYWAVVVGQSLVVASCSHSGTPVHMESVLLRYEQGQVRKMGFSRSHTLSLTVNNQ